MLLFAVFRKKVLARIDSSRESDSAEVHDTREQLHNGEQLQVPAVSLPEELPVFRIPAFEKRPKYAVKKQDDLVEMADSSVNRGAAVIQTLRERNRRRKMKKKRHKQRMRQQLEILGDTDVMTEKHEPSKANPFVFGGVIETELKTTSQYIDTDTELLNVENS